MRRFFEIILICIGLFAVFYGISLYLGSLDNFLPKYTLTTQTDQHFGDSIPSLSPHQTVPTALDENGDTVNALMLEVNSINNILTWCSFIVGVLTIVAAIFGILSVSAFRDETRRNIETSERRINDLTQNLTNSLDESTSNQNTSLEAFQRNIDELTHNLTTTLNESISNQDTRLEAFQQNIDENNVALNIIEGYRETLARQEEYINQTINYLFQATSANINQMSNQEQAREILRRIYHEMLIARLYRISLNAVNNETYNRERFAVLAYLEMNGTREDIPHLEYVVQHDTNEDNRRRAIEVIGIIRSRG
jgi:hypothetical protein